MSNFTGAYVREIAEVLAASVLSRQHAIVLSAPGTGKTEILLSAARQWVGEGRYSYVSLDPSTPPEEIKGSFSPAEFFESGKFVRVEEGTPHDPNNEIIIIDEIGRGSGIVFDLLLKTLKMVGRRQPTVWGISNFMPRDDRLEALIDRFTLWLWTNPGILNMADIVRVQLHSNGAPQLDMKGLPTWDEIEHVWQATPGPQAEKAVADLLRDLEQEAKQNGRRPNLRTAAQWTHLLFRAGVWHSGTADFATVPDDAVKMLRYAWAATSPDESASWSKIAGSVVDAVGAAIESAMAQVVGEMRKVAGMDAGKRSATIPQLGKLMQSTQATLESLAGADDERVQTAITQMNTWLSAAITGREIE
jgi:MoxR-like ATPase